MRVGLLFTLLQALRGRPTLRLFREREKRQWDSREKAAEYQLLRLNSLLEHAQQHIPFYRERFREHGVAAAEIQSLDEFSARVPLLSRAEITDNLPALHAENFDGPLITHVTGGSSGHPLSFPRDVDSIAATWADFLLSRSWWGISMGAPSAKIWGHWHDPKGALRHALFESKEFIKRRILNMEFLSAYAMNEATMAQFAKRVRRRKPRTLYGYASALVTFAQYVDDNDVDLELPPETVIIPTSEPLFDSTRAFLRRVYGRPVANEYGACEVGLIAFDCPGGSMHLMQDSLYVEVVDAQGNPLPRGEVGEIVVTTLANSAVPLIRYRLGDVATISDQPCSCGRQGDTLGTVQGRIWAMIQGPTGSIVYPQIITLLVMGYFPQARRFQAIQETIDHVTVLVESSDELPAAGVESVIRELQQKLSEQVQVEVNRVDEIETERSGKFAVVKTHLR